MTIRLHKRLVKNEEGKGERTRDQENRIERDRRWGEKGEKNNENEWWLSKNLVL